MSFNPIIPVIQNLSGYPMVKASDVLYEYIFVNNDNGTGQVVLPTGFANSLFNAISPSFRQLGYTLPFTVIATNATENLINYANNDSSFTLTSHASGWNNGRFVGSYQMMFILTNLNPAQWTVFDLDSYGVDYGEQ